MTSSRYSRPSTSRVLSDHDSRLARAEIGNPRATFRAGITDHFDDMELERRAYDSVTSTGGTDTVFWDYWDDTYDRSIFATSLAVGGIDDGRLGAVQLLVPGLYAIRASIDWQTPTFTLVGAFNTWVGTNYDDGSVNHIYADLSSEIILGCWPVDQFRFLWPAYTASENLVEITVAHDNTAEEPLYIPGGFAGYWANPPMLSISYLGGLSSDQEFYADV